MDFYIRLILQKVFHFLEEKKKNNSISDTG